MTLTAMMFGAPGLLAGLSLASLPIIIHLLNRRRFKEMDWAAVRWLLEAMRKNRRRIQLEQWILLAIRTLVIALVVAAMARPMLEGAGLGFMLPGAATHNIIVLDNTLSDQALLADRTRWDRAKDLAHSVLDHSQQGDLCSVVVLGSSASVLVGDPSPYLSSVAEEIDAIKPQHTAGRIEQAVDKVLELLPLSKGTRKQVFFISDLQRNTWQSGDEDGSAEFAHKLAGLSEQAGCTILDVSGGEPDNLAVVGIQLADPVAVKDRQALITATVVNFSGGDKDDLPIELVVDGEVESTQRTSIPAGENRSLTFPFTFTRAGDQTIGARIPDDSLRQDNMRLLAIEVRDAIKVLLVDGEPAGVPFEGETDYLRVALSPQSIERQSTLFQCRTALESELLETPLEEFDVVVLANVGQFSEREAAVLEEYLARGGGVLFFLGEQCQIEAYNERLYREGKGVLPVKLVGVRGQADRTGPVFSFDPLQYKHRVVDPFRQHEQAGLLTTRVFRFVDTQPEKIPSVQVALAYQSGEAALVLADVRRGRVGLVTTSADLAWNTWAISPSFLPVMHELILELAFGKGRAPEALTGEEIELPVPRLGTSVEVRVRPPGEAEAIPVPVKLRDALPVANFAATDVVGAYRFEFGPPVDRSRTVAVNHSPAESNLARMDDEALAALAPGWRYTRLESWQSERARANVSSSSQSELHRPLLHLALALLFLETYLAWKFSHHT